MYLSGQGVPPNNAEAIRWLRLAADQGLAHAQYKLGFQYAQDQGVPQNYAEALKWTRLAAEQGLAEAEYNLGVAYKNGEGVPQDYVRAHMWFNVSAAQGTKEAVIERDRLALRMTPAQIGDAQRLAREWKPTNQRPE
jgi:TPR repeat protein